mgnify:CR=1
MVRLNDKGAGATESASAIESHNGFGGQFSVTVDTMRHRRALEDTAH